MHCTHRNPSVPAYYASDSAITDTAVHEIDMVRWLFDEEIVATDVLTPRRSRNGGDLPDPMILLLEMESGIVVDIEVSVNIRYGYDIRGEVVGEDGTAALGEASPVTVRHSGGVTSPVPADWRERFIRAYDTEFQEWIDAVRSGGELGPSAWDGYAAAVVSDAALEARRTGTRTAVQMADKPALYAPRD
jgi:myo-inositol 2-dehydrogenase/D-chiro-inositol 1-dehydrogenase